MTDFSTYAPGITAPALFGFAITPDDEADLTRRVRSVTINGEGVIAYVNWQGETCTTGVLPVGSYPMLAARILATGTTAAGLTGWA